MPRHTYPRPEYQHALTASRILARHASVTGIPITLPVPIELIIEQTHRLEILWDEIEDPPGTIILGKLKPICRRIVLNIRHESLFEEWIGPEHFTLAHELAHWIYDADNPEQFAFNLDEQPADLYCYGPADSPGSRALETIQIREVNANKLAAHLLLPEDLVRKVSIREILTDFPGTARTWQVSRKTLRIRLHELGLISERDIAQFNLM